MSRPRYKAHLHRRSADDAQTLSEFARVLAGRAGAGEDVANPYKAVSCVYACVKKKANALSMLSLRVSTAADEVVEDGPLAMLAEQPNSEMNGRAFLRATSAFLDLFGVVYWIKQMPGSRLLGLRPASPIEVTEVPGPLGLADHYVYTPIGAARGQSVILTRDEVHKVVDPDFGSGDLDKPLSAREAAGLAIRQHYKADVANDQSLQHGAGGGLGLKTEGNLTEPQRKDLEGALEDRHSGYANRHRWMLLEGGLSVEKLFSTFAEMEFTELKYFSREDICVAYDMNPLVVGYGGREGLGSGQHTEAAHVIAWTDTHLPRAAWIADEWMECVGPHFDRDASLSLRDARRRKLSIGERTNRIRRDLRQRAVARGRKYYAWFDHSGISILQKASLELAEQAANWNERGVPLNQLLSAYDLPFEEVPWGNTWYKPFGLVDVQDESAGPGSEDPAGDPDPDDDPIDDAPKDKGHHRDSAPDHVRRLTAAQLNKLWEMWRSSWAGIERHMASRVSRHFSELRREVLARLGQHVPKGAKAIAPDRRRDVISEILFDLFDANARLLSKAQPLIIEAYRLGGEQVMAEDAAAAGKDAPDPFRIKDPAVEQAMRSRQIRLKGTNKTLRQRLAAQLAEAITNHETTDKIADRLRTEFNYASARAKTIARTEVGGAVEDARQQGRVQAAVPMKSWLWSRKETGRPWHMEAEDQTLAAPIPTNNNFVLPQTGAETPHPRGPGLTAEDAANCGCTTLSRYPDDQIRDARMIAHYVERGFFTYDDMQQRDAQRSNP